jgi:hypothetical protein
MPKLKGEGAEEFSQAVRLLKQAAEHGTTPGETDDPRDAAVAVAQSMRHFEAALEGTIACTHRSMWHSQARGLRKKLIRLCGCCRPDG